MKTVFVDENIKRFCEVIFEINTINKELEKERADFYDGGYSFEECNSTKIKKLIDLQNELKCLLKRDTGSLILLPIAQLLISGKSVALLAIP